MVVAGLVGRDILTKLLLARHGDTEFNRARRFQGHGDIELNAAGLSKAKRLRDRLVAEGIDAIYSSDLRRAVVTAQIIASRHQLEVVTCAELREIDFGKFEGLVVEEASQLYPKVAKLWVRGSRRLRFPDGESFNEFARRVSKFLGMVERHTLEQTILVVAHSGPLRLLMCHLLGIGLGHWHQLCLNIASLSIMETYPDRAVISLLNDTSHLDEGGG